MLGLPAKQANRNFNKHPVNSHSVLLWIEKKSNNGFRPRNFRKIVVATAAKIFQFKINFPSNLSHSKEN